MKWEVLKWCFSGWYTVESTELEYLWVTGTKIIDLQIKWEGGFWNLGAGVFTWASKERKNLWAKTAWTLTIIGNEWASRGSKQVVSQSVMEVRKLEINCLLGCYEYID